MSVSHVNSSTTSLTSARLMLDTRRTRARAPSPSILSFRRLVGGGRFGGWSGAVVSYRMPLEPIVNVSKSEQTGFTWLSTPDALVLSWYAISRPSGFIGSALSYWIRQTVGRVWPRTPCWPPKPAISLPLAALSSGQSLYTIDEPLLSSLRPDVILTQDICSVCAIDLPTVERAAAAMGPSPPRVLSLNPLTLDDVLRNVLEVGAAKTAEPRQFVAAHDAEGDAR